MQTEADISNIAELLAALRENLEGSVYWYRGQSDVSWRLLPSLARENDGLMRETHLIAQFKQSASLLLNPIPSNDWEWLTVMQHYRVPTRLLDWSESPLVALYFAVQDHSDSDGALWILDPTKLNLESRISPDYDRYIPYLNERTTENYLPDSLRSESMTKLRPIAVIAPRNTPRMQAQLGVFTVSHRDPTPIEEVGSRQHVRKYRIPSGAKATLRTELELLSFNRFQLFPGLQSLGELLGGSQNA